MSDYVQPRLLPGMAEFTGVIRILWDRDNVTFDVKFPFHTVSTRIRRALMDLGIKNPRISIECHAAYPERFEKEREIERAAYIEDDDIELFYAAKSRDKKIFQGVDAKIQEILENIITSGQAQREMVIVGVMTGDGDYRDLMGTLRENGLIVLSIKPKKFISEKGNETTVSSKSLERAGDYNASMEDIDNTEGVLVKWWPAEAENMKKKDALEVLKMSYLIEEDKDEDEEDWGEYLVKRFGQTWLCNLKKKHLSYELLGAYLRDALISLRDVL